jgi:hypothetical protein
LTRFEPFSYGYPMVGQHFCLQCGESLSVHVPIRAEARDTRGPRAGE